MSLLKASVVKLLRPRLFGVQVRSTSRVASSGSSCTPNALDLGPTRGHDNSKQPCLHVDGHVPVIDGTNIFFPVIEGCNKRANEAALTKFVVHNSGKIAARLFANVEYRKWLSRNRVALATEAPSKCVMKQPSYQTPASFGTPTNAAALVLRFARIAYDISIADSLDRRTGVVAGVLEDILDNRSLDCNQVAAIVNAVSQAQKQKACVKGSSTIPDIIRFLLHENVWQKLNAEQRRFVASSTAWLQCGKMTSNGIAEGIKAFENMWHNMQHEQRCLAEAQLHNHYLKMSLSFGRYLQKQIPVSIDSTS